MLFVKPIYLYIKIHKEDEKLNKRAALALKEENADFERLKEEEKKELIKKKGKEEEWWRIITDDSSNEGAHSFMDIFIH